MASDGRRRCVRIWCESLPWPAYVQHLQAQGYKIRAQILNYPDGGLGEVELAVASTRALLHRFDEINQRFSEPMSDEAMSALLEEQARVQDRIDAQEGDRPRGRIGAGRGVEVEAMLDGRDRDRDPGRGPLRDQPAAHRHRPRGVPLP